MNGTANLTEIQTRFLNVFRSNVQALTSALVFEQEYAVVDCISDPQSKYPILLGNVATMEALYFEEMLKSALRVVVQNPLAPSLFSRILGRNVTEADLLEVVDGFKMSEYALTLVATLADRQNRYLFTGSALQSSMVRATDPIGEKLGVEFAGQPTYPVATGLSATYFISLFLDQIFFMVNGVLALLAIMLIYSLLLSDVDEKTFEYGMLRSLGLPHRVLVLLLFLQSLFFSVPGILLGFLVCFIIYVPVDLFFSVFATVDTRMTLQSSAIILGVGAHLGNLFVLYD